MEAVLSGDGPAHSTAWRGPGRGGMDSRLTDSLSGSSIHSASVHACTLGPHGCRPPKDTEEMTGTEEILDGGVSRGNRGLRFPHQPPTSVHSPPTCTSNPSWLRKSQDSECQILMLPPPPHLLHISRLLQQCLRADSEAHVWADCLPHPEICNHSDRSSGLPNPLQCCCVLWQRGTVACWHTGSAAGGFRHTHHHTQVPSQHGKEVELWVSFIDRCPLVPNGGRRLYTLHLFPLLSSKVQSALKALTHTHTQAFFLTFLSQILLPLHSFPLFYPCVSLLICIALPSCFLCVSG